MIRQVTYTPLRSQGSSRSVFQTMILQKNILEAKKSQSYVESDKLQTQPTEQ